MLLRGVATVVHLFVMRACFSGAGFVMVFVLITSRNRDPAALAPRDDVLLALLVRARPPHRLGRLARPQAQRASWVSEIPSAGCFR
ncbi:MAG: hypothetical protein ACR2H2_12610 [Solirubrobacteraceae bacterium]